MKKRKIPFKQAQKEAEKRGYVLTKEDYDYAIRGGGVYLEKTSVQSGKSNKRIDVQRRAMPPGLRLSKTGRIYYESRANRSDKRTLLGVKGKKKKVNSSLLNAFWGFCSGVATTLVVKKIIK